MHPKSLKTSRFLVLAAIFAAGSGAAFAAPSAMAAEAQSTIAWGADLNEALRHAAVSGKPILVHFYSDNCVPCKMLEAKAFKNPTLGAVMSTTVLPVKIKYEEHRDVAQHYQITRFPTDLFLHPNGEEIYRTVSPQDPADYAKLLERIAVKNRDWVVVRMSKLSTPNPNERPANPSRFDTATLQDSHPTTTRSPLFQTASQTSEANRADYQLFSPLDSETNPVEAETEAASRNPFLLASHASEAKENRYQRQTPRENSSATPTLAHPTSSTSPAPADKEPLAAVTLGGVFIEDNSVGLDGYCPVSLCGTPNRWVLGNEAFSVKHRGRIYRCASEEARTLFLQEPDRYSPVLSGYDLVHFLETGKLEPGKREYGWFSNGHVFLFMNEANKIHFDAHVVQYLQSFRAAAASDRVAQQPDGTALQR